MNDPIVDEVRRVRDAHAARFNYDLDAIFQEIKRREKESGLVFIQGVAHQPVPNKALQPTGAAISVSQDSKSLDAAPAAERYRSPAWPFDGHSMNESLTKWLSEPRTALTKAVSECVRDHVASLRKQGVRPYGYALLPGESYDLHSVVAAYNCESDIKVSVGDKLYRYYKYSVDEWLHYIHDGFDRANQCMVDANAEFAAMYVDDGDGDMDDFRIAHSRALLEAILKGFEAAKHEGVFGGPEIYLAMWISDSRHEIMGQSVRRLNSAAVVKEYMAEFG